MRQQFLLSAVLVATVTGAALAGSIAKGKSVFGSIIRFEPNMESRRLFSVPQGDPVVFVAETGSFLSDWQWVKVRYGKREGYVWGGTVCTTDVQLKGVHFGCDN